MTRTPAELKSEILRLSREYSGLTHQNHRPGYEKKSRTHPPFVPGQTTVPYAGRVFDEDEVEAAVSATLDFWLTLGPEGDEFEKELAQFLKVKKSILVNSGSSANLVAISALTSSKLGERRLKLRPPLPRFCKTALCRSSSTTIRSR
jgi:CDP-6-deoxy-D-xylo-4-hexulose-3-dehydrase